MGHFKQGSGNDRFGSGSDRGGSRFGGSNSGRPSFPKKSWGEQGSGNRETVMYQATCSDCNKSCEVPFRPAQGKPVYCNDCFGGKRGQSTEGFVRKEFSTAPPAKINFESNKGNDDVKRQLEAVNIKLERLIQTVDTLIRMKLAQQKEVVRNVPAVLPKAPVEKEPVKKEATMKTSVKKTAKKMGVKKNKR